MTKRFNTISAAVAAFAIGAAVIAGSAGSAQAGEHMKTLTSHTWKLGYTKDENRYVKFVMVDTSHDARTTRIHSRANWAPGYEYNGGGGYQRIVQREPRQAPHMVAKVEHRDTWAPGYAADDSGYTRVTYVSSDAATGTMLAGDAGGGPAQVAEAR